MAEKKPIDILFEEKKRYEESSKDQRTEITEIYNAYQGKMEQVISTPYDTKETIPKMRTEIAYVKPFIFSGEPEIEVEGVGDEDKNISKILEKIVNYRISQSIPNAYEKIEDWVHQATTFGTSLIQVVWNFKTEKKSEPVLDEMGQPVISEDGQPQVNEYEVPTIDEPDLVVPNIQDCFYNPMLPDVVNQTSIIIRSILPLEDVKANPTYKDTDKLQGKDNLSTSDTNSSSQLGDTIMSNQKGMVEIYERLTKDKIETAADDKERLMLREASHEYGFIPMVKFVFEKDTIPNIFNGKGVGQNTLGLSKAYYKMFNQTLTNVKLCNNPMSVSAKGTKINKEQLVSKPGGNVEVDTGGKRLDDVFQWMQLPDIKQGAIQLLDKIDDEHKRASGANDLLQGGASNDTLGQDQIAQSNSSNRFELIQRRFKHALADVAEMIIKMELIHLQSPDAPILRIFSDEMEVTDPLTGQKVMQSGMRQKVYEILVNEAKDIKYNVKIKGDTTVARNKQLESKRLVDLFDLSQNFLTDQEKRSFIRRIAERQGESNIDEIIAETNPIMQQQEMMNAQQPQGSFNRVGADGQSQKQV
jgi:hypothetical protein